jgi:hypothetical protein
VDGALPSGDTAVRAEIKVEQVHCRVGNTLYSFPL